MMNELFDKAHAFVEKWEGGFCNDKNDPGGATKYGVSLRFLRQEGYDIDGDGDIDIDDVRAVTKDDARRIFRKHFWLVDFQKLAETHPRMAWICYDTAVNMGPGYAKRLCQQAVGTKADGIWGPKTWAAIKVSSDVISAWSMIDLRKARYVELTEKNPSLKDFLKGWHNRVNDLARAVAGI